jgi:phosphohistidine swiveling domain-containing protein
MPLIGDGPVHVSAWRSRWTTVNAEEALPGVLLPLTWSFYGPGTRRAMVQVWKNLGALPRGFPTDQADVDQWFVGTFFGRIAMNLDRYGEMADLMPGTSAAALEEQFFGNARSGPVTSSRRRYPFIAVRAPNAIRRARRATLRDWREVAGWRRASIALLAPGATQLARAALLDAQRRLEVAVLNHTLLTMVAQGCYEQVTTLCERAGMPGLELHLTTSNKGIDEYRMVCDTWALARDEKTMAEFLDEHGYHGPDEGHLNSRVWREDPTPVHDVVSRYRTLSPEADPAYAARRRVERHRRARADLLAALPRSRRPGAAALLRMATSMPEYRELGKSIFLQTVDVARAAARILGSHAESGGRLDSAQDVYFLTVEEAVDTARTGLQEVAARRRKQDEYFRLVELPSMWVGNPEPLGRAEVNLGGVELRGLGVSAGTAEGNVRIIDDPSICDVEPGDILVCHITDPSWSATMALAGGLVIDVGSAISHGAIVARELGIPCVINTRNGTRLLRNGDRICIDGTAGTVTRAKCR